MSKMKKILVTGCAGFIGHALCKNSAKSLKFMDWCFWKKLWDRNKKKRNVNY